MALGRVALPGFLVYGIGLGDMVLVEARDAVLPLPSALAAKLCVLLKTRRKEPGIADAGSSRFTVLAVEVASLGDALRLLGLQGPSGYRLSDPLPVLGAPPGGPLVCP